jgi:hypothetical protein
MIFVVVELINWKLLVGLFMFNKLFRTLANAADVFNSLNNIQ